MDIILSLPNQGHEARFRCIHHYGKLKIISLIFKYQCNGGGVEHKVGVREHGDPALSNLLKVLLVLYVMV